MKRIVLPVFNNRVAPLFDVACCFSVFDTEGDAIIRQDIVHLAVENPSDKINELHSRNVNLIICSAISRYLMDVINARGIELLPGIIGEVNEVVTACITDSLRIDRYAMPGCKWRKRGHRGKHGRCPRYSEIRDFYQQ